MPPDYESNIKRYPVIYYFHGHSDRYTLEKYDDGKDTIPKIADFVANHDAIVVSVDGYVARDYTGFYGGTPWDIMRDGGDYDFGEYFKELVAHIDKTYRTLTDRRHRATSGLSMGGFMSLWLSARYPQQLDRAKVYSDSPWVTEVADLEEQKQLEWTSAKERTSVIRLSPDTPHGTVIPPLLDNESWSYYYTPDVRYGKEDLHHAFQLHTHHLHRWEVRVP